MMGSFRFSVEQAEITTIFRDFFFIMYGNNWEKLNLRYNTMIGEQLKALITGFCKLTNHQKTQWVERFDSWTPSTLRAQLEGLVESGGLL